MPPEVAESMKEGADHAKTCDGLDYKGTVSGVKTDDMKKEAGAY